MLGCSIAELSREDGTMEFTKYELYDLLNRPGPLWLVNADLSGADLRGAIINEANLSEANLSGADLSGAKLGYTNLSGANLSGAKYDKNTNWPRGFDPQKAGAILV
jgi:hypothetical protein